jgi:hypothetical protein
MHLPVGLLLLDAAQIGQRIHQAKELNANYSSLYKGRSEEDLAEVAPYLFRTSKRVEFRNWYLENGWGRAWGLMVNTHFPFDEVHKHFRKFLLVKTEDSQELYFRFYDPRVLRVFLPSCNRKQLGEFFGPVEHFICEDQNADYGLVYSLQNQILKINRISKEHLINSLGFS